MPQRTRWGSKTRVVTCRVPIDTFNWLKEEASQYPSRWFDGSAKEIENSKRNMSAGEYAAQILVDRSRGEVTGSFQ